MVIAVEDINKGLGNTFTQHVNGKLKDKFGWVNEFNLIHNSFSHAVYRYNPQDMKSMPVSLNQGGYSYPNILHFGFILLQEYIASRC